jgi:cyclophilin family peptidyl-prolyl cis-trans isomerase
LKALCTGEKGKSKFKKEKDLHYKGCPMHRIIAGYMAQGNFVCMRFDVKSGGDVINGDGSGGESIYGGKFNDELAGLKRKFVRGTVGMANSGKNSNTSGFFFLFADSQAVREI